MSNFMTVTDTRTGKKKRRDLTKKAQTKNQVNGERIGSNGNKPNVNGQPVGSNKQQPQVNGKPIGSNRKKQAFEKVIPKRLRYKDQKHQKLGSFSDTANDALKRVTQAKNRRYRADERQAYRNMYDQKQNRQFKGDLAQQRMSHERGMQQDQQRFKGDQYQVENLHDQAMYKERMRSNDIDAEKLALEREQYKNELQKERFKRFEEQAGGIEWDTDEDKQLAMDYFMKTGEMPALQDNETWYQWGGMGVNEEDADYEEFMRDQQG